MKTSLYSSATLLTGSRFSLRLPQLVLVSVTPWRGETADISPALELLEALNADTESSTHGKVCSLLVVRTVNAGKAGESCHRRKSVCASDSRCVVVYG